jgi:hypothetical protein
MGHIIPLITKSAGVNKKKAETLPTGSFLGMMVTTTHGGA